MKAKQNAGNMPESTAGAVKTASAILADKSPGRGGKARETRQEGPQRESEPSESNAIDGQTEDVEDLLALVQQIEMSGFDDDTWVGMIYDDPRRLPLSVKDICFHSHDAKGRPTGVIDQRIYVYLTHTQHIFICGGVPYIYTDGVYRMDLRGTVIKTLIGECCLEQYVRSTTKDRIFRMFLQDCNLEREPDELNVHSGHYINFRNGMYDVIRKKLYPHSPKIFSVNQVPWDYDPNADHGPGNEIENFLSYSVPDPEDREMLLEYIGLCCSIDVRQQKMLVICGDGGTGKSTVINLVQKIVGRRNTSNVAMSKLSKDFQAIRMMGKLLNSCADLEIDALDDVTMIKKLIGEDAISDSYKGKDIISFDNYAKLLFSTNELPLVRNEKTEGFYRRLLILVMNQKPEKRDFQLPDRLEKQIPYLLHLAMEALHRMYKRGRILESHNSLARVKQLRADSDTIEAFMDECCVKADDEEKIDRVMLYKRYCEFCEENERQSHQRTAFFKALRNKGLPECKSHGSWFFKGIAFRQDGAGDDGFMEVPDADPMSDIPFPE